MITPVLASAFTLSFAANLFLFVRNRRLKKTPPKQESYEVQELLHDLLSGSGLVKVQRISPADIFLRSTRGDA